MPCSHSSQLARSTTSDLCDAELEELLLELIELLGEVRLGLVGELVCLDLCHCWLMEFEGGING